MAVDFQKFAPRFVRSYWETVKHGRFAMPPNEPVEESVEELLAAVSFDVDPLPDSEGRLLTMRSKSGDWWKFTFRKGEVGWEVLGCTARSGDSMPHDLLDSIYAPYFAPFLRHVAKDANSPKNA